MGGWQLCESAWERGSLGLSPVPLGVVGWADAAGSRRIGHGRNSNEREAAGTRNLSTRSINSRPRSKSNIVLERRKITETFQMTKLKL